jgi:hypothetical protein
MGHGVGGVMEAGIMSWDGATGPSADGCVIWPLYERFEKRNVNGG